MRIASLRFRYDSPDVHVRRGIKSSWSSRVHPSRALLMGSMSARKQRVRRAEAVEGSSQESLRGNRVGACGISGLRQVGWDARGKRRILMETVGRRLEFEWQLIKGPCLTRTSVKRQCRVSARSTWSR